MWRKYVCLSGFPSLASIGPGGSFGVSHSTGESKDAASVYVKEDSGHDVPSLDQKNKYYKETYSDRSNTTWRERLRLMWRADEWKNRSPELEFVKDASFLAIFSGFILGSYIESAKTTRLFLEKNKHTMFEQPREAQVALQDRVILSLIKGGWKYGLRIGTLVFAYTSITQSLATVRNYINPLDHMAAGAVVGSLWKFSMGPKGMVGGAVAGSIMGIQGGVIMWLFQKASGETIEEKWKREFDHKETISKLKSEQKFEKYDLAEEAKKGLAENTTGESDQMSDNSSSASNIVKNVLLWANQKFGIFSDSWIISDHNRKEKSDGDDSVPSKS